MSNVTLVIAMPLLKKFLFRVLGMISKKLQEKYFPLELKGLHCILKYPPVTQISKENSIASLTLNFEFTNNTHYEMSIFSIEGRLTLAGEGIILLNFHKSKLLHLKVGHSGQYWVLKSLTMYEATRIETLFNEEKSKELQIEIDISLITIFGIINHRITLNRNMEFHNN
jgi:hypothetical protein